MTQTVRSTRGTCPTCLEEVDAAVVTDEHGAYLEKRCEEHGAHRQLLSHHPDEWADLDDFFFRVNADERPQRDFIVRMTEQCNLDCPICLARANTHDTPDLDLSGLERLLSERRGVKIDLMAAEPTLRKDLVDWIKKVKETGNLAALHTNGLKLAKLSYCQEIADAGVDEVFLQFDGFSSEADVALRGRPLRIARMKALENLRKCGISTSLIAVIAKDLNEEQVSELYEFALLPENDHVKELLFLGLRQLGRARDGDGPPGGDLVPDEIIDLLCAQEPRIKRQDIRRFNKLYFALLSTFSVRKCLYIQHYLIARGGRGGWTPFSELADLEALERVAEKYAERLHEAPYTARAALLMQMARHGVNKQTMGLLMDLLKMQQLLKDGMNLREFPGRFLLLGFITACDPLNFDAAVAATCGKGELSVDGGFEESGAVANVLREQRNDEDRRGPCADF